MTLSITNELLSYAPDLKELVKSAEQAEVLSTASKGETLFSYIKMGFMEKVAGVDVDPRDKYRILKAATLYGIEKEASEIVGIIAQKAHVKEASAMANEAQLVIAQDNFEAMDAGFVNQERMVKMARALSDNYNEDITSDAVKQYSCDGYLCKSAAERSLKARFMATADHTFEKLASALESLNTDTFSTEDKRKFADFIYGLDKKAGLTARGFNVYKEIFLTKSAAISSSIMVSLPNNKQVSVDRIMAVAPDLKAALGADVVKELSGDPQNVKAVVDSLPLDLKSIIARYV